MSAAEVFSKETTGFLIGHTDKQIINGRMEQCMAIHSAYPIQTADRGRNQVGFGNNAARVRVENTASAVGFSIIGGFHSHTNASSKLSKEDKEFCWGYLEEVEAKMGLNRWLELVVAIKKVKRPEATNQLKQIHRNEGLMPGFYPRLNGPSAQGYLIVDEKTSFNIEISGYWFEKGKTTESLISYSRF
jgi:proteasome lid subunit RPN8/RPN11